MKRSFDSWSIYEKRCVLRENARLITSQTYFQYQVKLYVWRKYLIEEYFDTETRKVTRISVANHFDLNKYLGQIGLNALADIAGITISRSSSKEY